VDGFLESPPAEEEMLKALKRLRNILAPVECDIPLGQHSRYITQRAGIFDELRSALRLTPSKSKVNPPEAAVTTEELSDIRKQVEALILSLKSRRDESITNSDICKAISIIIRHIDKHGSSLWGHEITLPSGETRLADRTNNYAEGFFRDLKHGERRRSGRKVLTQDFESLPPEAALARNLRCEDYLTIVCGSIDQLHKSFAHLDATYRSARLSGERSMRIPQRTADISSASLSTPDRRLVRAVEMKQRLLAAAQV
jgi:hypothetical protein